MTPDRNPNQVPPAAPGGRLDPEAAPAPAQAPADAVNWDCALSTIEGGPVAKLTVGDKMLLKCSGPTVSEWKAAPKIQFPNPEDEFTLAIVEPKKTGINDGEWIVTGYKPGGYKPDWILITDGGNNVKVTGLSWTVESVVEPPKEGEKAEPFPPKGPVFLIWPWWLWASIAGVAVLIGLVAYFRIRRYRARKALLERLAQKGTVLTPYAEFHKVLRQLSRKHPEKPEDYLKQLDDSFRAYLMREFVVPADEWSDGAVLKDIKKRNKTLFKEAGKDLAAAMREMKRAKAAKRINVADCEQLQEISRKLVDKINARKEARS